MEQQKEDLEIQIQQANQQYQDSMADLKEAAVVLKQPLLRPRMSFQIE